MAETVQNLRPHWTLVKKNMSVMKAVLMPPGKTQKCYITLLILKRQSLKSHVSGVFFQPINLKIMNYCYMEEILHHLGCIKLCNKSGYLWISTISTGAGFPSPTMIMHHRLSSPFRQLLLSFWGDKFESEVAYTQFSLAPREPTVFQKGSRFLFCGALVKWAMKIKKHGCLG